MEGGYAMAASLVLMLALAGISPGEFVAELPTFHCLGYRWLVSGEGASRGRVTVEYRRRGTDEWSRSMDLFRVDRRGMPSPPPAGTELFAGSILDLRPDTEYDVKLTLLADGNVVAEKRITQRTWKPPQLAAPKRVLHVAPGTGGGSGSEASPFRGLAAAASSARPGDLFLVLPGTYRGPARFTRNGTAELPIAWRSVKPHEAVIEVAEGDIVINAGGARHVIVEGFATRGGRLGVAVHGASNVTVRGCTFASIRRGVMGDSGESRIVVMDCVFEGKHVWQKKSPTKTEDRAVDLSGSGHVVCYNRISGYRDGIDTRTPGPANGVDIHNNHITVCTDDAIELDFSNHNCRAYDNLIHDCQMGISFQPVYGGPAYAVRNVMYNVAHEVFKLHVTPPNTGKPTSGGVLLHNTIVKKGVPFRVWSDEGPARFFYARNNLYVGDEGPHALEITCPMQEADFDYDVFAGRFGTFASWNGKRHGSISAFGAKASQERHGRAVRDAGGLFASGLAPPADLATLHEVDPARFVPAPSSAAVDAGVALPGVNDAFSGRAPDAGAFELGAPVPHYGPGYEEATRGRPARVAEGRERKPKAKRATRRLREGALAEWDAELRDMLLRRFEKEPPITFFFHMVRGKATVVSVTEDGIGASARGTNLNATWERLSLADKRSLAAAAASDSPMEQAIVAFYIMAAGGSELDAREHLVASDILADAVRMSFETVEVGERQTTEQ